MTARRSLPLAPLLGLALLLAPRMSYPAIGADGAWNEVPPPMRAYHSAVYDPPRDRMILYGGGAARMWQLDLTTLVWTPFDVTGTAPSIRSQHSAIYDPVRDRMIVFGGRPVSGTLLNDVWSLNLSGTPTWTRLFPSGTLPRARYGHTATYDPVRDRMVVFGGLTSNIPSSEVWELTLGTTPAWHKLATIGDPGPRGGHSTVYDPVRDRLLIYGGGGSALSGYYDLWALSFADSLRWTRLSEYGPSWETRTGHTAYYDAAADRMILCGGHSDSYTDGGAELGDVSTFDFATASWSWYLTNVGVPGFHAGILDPVRHRLVLHGGKGYDAFANATVAIQLTPLCTVPLSGEPAPFGREDHAVTYDPNRDRLLVFGGREFYYGGESVMGDLWAFSLSTLQWTEVDDGDFGYAPPPAVYAHTAIYEPAADRLIAYGGLRSGSYIESRVLQYRFSTPTGWSDITPPGSGPPGRYAHTAIYDPGGARMIVFGGQTAAGTVNDLWQLSLSGAPAWSPIAAGGTPPPAMNRHGAVYDPISRRMIVVSGAGVWGLSFTGEPIWTSIPTTGGPPTSPYTVFYWNTTIFDPTHNRILVYTGAGAWSLDLTPSPAVWRALSPDNEAPPTRALGAAAWDGARGRMLIFGGYQPGYIGSTYFLSDIWSLQITDPATETTADLIRAEVIDGVVRVAWRLSDPTDAVFVERREPDQAWRTLVAVTRDAQGRVDLEDRDVMGGHTYSYRLRVQYGAQALFLGETSVEVPLEATRASLSPVASPASSIRLRLTLPRDYDPRSRIELLDLQGRRLEERLVGTGRAGTTLLELGTGERWNPGIYLVRLRAGDRTCTSRVVLLR